jgi:hypothetical protein
MKQRRSGCRYNYLIFHWRPLAVELGTNGACQTWRFTDPNTLMCNLNPSCSSDLTERKWSFLLDQFTSVSFYIASRNFSHCLLRVSSLRDGVDNTRMRTALFLSPFISRLRNTFFFLSKKSRYMFIVVSRFLLASVQSVLLSFVNRLLLLFLLSSSRSVSPLHSLTGRFKK